MPVYKLPGSAIQANTITTTQLMTTVVTQISAGGGPKVKSLIYPGDDTAANSVGGQTVYITGSGFAANAQVLVNGSAVPSQSFISASNISFTTPALSTGTYPVYVINPEDGGTAILYPGLLISGEPTWTTSATLPGVDVSSAWSISLSATGDTPITYALAAGNTLPSGITLSANGLISGTLSSPPGSETTYNFSVVATDAQNQDSTRQFNVTASAGDPYFANTALLIHADGTNNGNNQHFIESSANTLTVTRTASANQGSFSPFSQTGWGVHLDGTGDYLSTNSAITLSSDFTIECWVSLASAQANYRMLCGQSTGSSGVYFSINSTGLEAQFGGSSGTTASCSHTFTVGTWYHVALVRSGGTVSIYVDGVSKSITNSSQSASFVVQYVGVGYSTSYPLHGFISNFRIVSSAVYSSGFTPPTAALSAIANTQLLVCQSNRFIDKSTTAFTITASGDAKIVAFSPFSPTAAYSTANNGGSVYVPSGTNGLTVASVPAIGTGNFTVEGWFWPTDDVVRAEFDSAWCTNAANFNGTDSMQGAVRSSHVMFRSNGTSDITAGVSIANRWTHIAWVRNGTTVNIYVNGVSVVSGTYSNSLAAGNLYISRPDSNQFRFNGWISGFRISNTAVYTGTFTPPTSPPAVTANTIALLNFTNAQIFDQTAKNSIECVGDAKVATSQYKYGTGSISFDGTGDFLKVIRTPMLDFGTGDFTVETWVRFNTVGIDQAILAGDGTTGGYDILYRTGIGLVIGRYNTAFDNTFSWSPSINTWYHIAWCRSGSSLRAFVDGTQIGTTATNTNAYNGGAVFNSIGTSDNGSNRLLNGYLDDLRVTKGYARYTSNFTAPSSAHKDK